MSALAPSLAAAVKTLIGGRRLTREAARAAFEAMLEDSASPALSAALLSALAALGESADELAGVVDVLLAHALRPPVAPELAARAVDVCGTGGDGRGTFNISTVAAFVVAGAGVPVAKHGNRAVSSACGSADVLSALGVNIEMPPERAAEALRSAGVTFLFAPLYHGVMKRVGPLRRELGVRTIFNLAGPLANPVGVSRQIVGVDRPERVAVVAEALRSRGTVHALVFSNADGGDELLPFGLTHVAELRGGAIRRSRLRASHFGQAEADPGALSGGDARTNAEIARGILSGDDTGPRAATVLMNAGAALVVAGRVRSLKEGVRVAQESLSSGAARRALESLVSVSGAV